MNCTAVKRNEGRNPACRDKSYCAPTEEGTDQWSCGESRPGGAGMRLGLIDQAVMNGVEGEFETIGDAELVEDVVEMVLDRLLGDEKFFANFLVAETLRDKLNNFFFAVAKQRLFASRTGLGRF
jgi:hypothetical protein